MGQATAAVPTLTPTVPLSRRDRLYRGDWIEFAAIITVITVVILLHMYKVAPLYTLLALQLVQWLSDYIH